MESRSSWPETEHALGLELAWDEPEAEGHRSTDGGSAEEKQIEGVVYVCTFIIIIIIILLLTFSCTRCLLLWSH